MQVYWKDEYESETWKIPVRWSGKRSLAFPAGSMAGNGPEGCVVERKGKRKAGNELEGYIWAGMCYSSEWEAGEQLECEIC